MSAYLEIFRAWLRWLFGLPAVVPPRPTKPRKPEPFGPPAPVVGLHNASHISDILDQLPTYFANLKALRKADEDAYAIFSRLGGSLPSNDSLFAQVVDPTWLAEPPTIRCLFLPRNDKKLITPISYMMRMAGGQVCVGRDGTAVFLPPGLCYRAVLVYVLDGVPTGGAFYVHIEPDGQINLLPERRMIYQKVKRGGFTRPEFAKPRWLQHISSDKGESTDEFVRAIISLTLSCRRPKEAILVRASHNGMVAAWTIDRNDAKRFFAKRETGLAVDGRRKRVLHYVGDFVRETGDTVQNVRAHYRGERSFDWKGYRIEISGLGFHHTDFFDADIAGYKDEPPRNSRMIALEKASAIIRRRYSKPVFLTPSRQRRSARVGEAE